MTYILTARERKVLRDLQFEGDAFLVPGQLPIGTGAITLDRLTKLGLLETGKGRWGDTGWRLTDDAYRCMYGLGQDKMVSGGGPYHALKVWSWPPTPDSDLKPPPPRHRLTPLPPRLQSPPPRLRSIDE